MHGFGHVCYHRGVGTSSWTESRFKCYLLMSGYLTGQPSSRNEASKCWRHSATLLSNITYKYHIVAPRRSSWKGLFCQNAITTDVSASGLHSVVSWMLNLTRNCYICYNHSYSFPIIHGNTCWPCNAKKHNLTIITIGRRFPDIDRVRDFYEIFFDFYRKFRIGGSNARGNKWSKDILELGRLVYSTNLLRRNKRFKHL